MTNLEGGGGKFDTVFLTRVYEAFSAPKKGLYKKGQCQISCYGFPGPDLRDIPIEKGNLPLH